MTTESEPMLLDTNVLVYALDEESPHHVPSRAVLERASRGDGDYRLSSQILAEFFAVVTNPRRVRAPRAAIEAVEAIDAFLAMPGDQPARERAGCREPMARDGSGVSRRWAERF